MNRIRPNRPAKQAALIVILLPAVCVLFSPGPATRSQTRRIGGTSDYRSPVSIVAGAGGSVLYVAEATADQVAAVDVASGEVVEEIPVGEHPAGLAISPDGSQLYVTSAVPAGRVYVVDLQRGCVIDSIAVGHTPIALAIGPEGRTLYVCNQFDNNIGVIDLPSWQQIETIDVPREPVAAALTSDGSLLFVANHLPAGPANGEHVAAMVSIIDTTACEVVTNIELPDGSVNLRGIAISPDGEYAYVTHILARYRFPTTYLERGWVNTNAMTVIDVAEHRYVNTVLLDDANRGAANPHGVACTPDGKTIVVTHAGTHEVSVIDRVALHARLLPAESARHFVSASTSTSGRRVSDSAYSAEDVPNDLTLMEGIRRRLRLKGNGPRGLAVVGTKVYVAEYFSDSIGEVDIDPDGVADARSIPLGEGAAMTTARHGEMLFHDASPAFQTWHSCASCHSGGARACALNWDLLNDGMLNAKNAKSLLLTHQTPPAMATGIRANAEIAVRSGIRYIQFAVPRRGNAEALDEYLKSLQPVASPHLVNGHLSEAARNGERLFRTAGCGQCHAGPHYTDMLRHNVGTGTAEEPRGRFDTPTLIEVWRTGPYLHDGRATTIRGVLTTFNNDDRHGQVSNLTEDELSDLVEYVLTR